MYSVIECLILHPQYDLFYKLKQLSGITFEIGESPFANRHPNDLRSPNFKVNDKEAMNQLHLTLLKLKELGALNFEIKVSNDGAPDNTETQFLIYEADPKKLMDINIWELTQIKIQLMGEKGELNSGRTEIHQIQLREKVQYIRSNARKMDELELRQNDLVLDDPETKVVTMEQISLEEKNNKFYSKLESFCDLFNVTKEDVEKEEAYRNCFALYEAGAIKVKHSYILDGERNPAAQVDIVTKKSEIVNSAPYSKKNMTWGPYHDETRLTVYGMALTTVKESGLSLNIAMAKKLFEEAKQRFLLFASSKYYMESTTKEKNDDLIKQQADASNGQTPIVSVRGSNSQQNCIVVTVAKKDSKVLTFLIPVDVTFGGKVAITDNKYGDFCGTYNNIDAFIDRFINNPGLRRELGYKDSMFNIFNFFNMFQNNDATPVKAPQYIQPRRNTLFPSFVASKESSEEKAESEYQPH